VVTLVCGVRRRRAPPVDTVLTAGAWIHDLAWQLSTGRGLGAVSTSTLAPSTSVQVSSTLVPPGGPGSGSKFDQGQGGKHQYPWRQEATVVDGNLITARTPADLGPWMRALLGGPCPPVEARRSAIAHSSEFLPMDWREIGTAPRLGAPPRKGPNHRQPGHGTSRTARRRSGAAALPSARRSVLAADVADDGGELLRRREVDVGDVVER
jgi:hypothetical protein